MSQLLEILGRAITIDTTDIIWHWLDTVRIPADNSKSVQYQQLKKIIELRADSKLDAANEQLRSYLFDNPSCVYGRMAAAAICLHNHQLQNAIEELNSVYMRQPNNTMALYALGYCYERLGKEAQAVEFYQDCLKFKSYLQLPAQRLAAIYFKNGQFEKTIEQYELLKNEYPDDISTLVMLGHLYIVNGQHSQAIETFNTAILMYPDNFNTQNDGIDQLIAEGRLHEALQATEDSLQNQPESPDLLLKYADILSMLGATGQAISQYEQALRICPDFLEATIKLGSQFLQMGAAQPAAQQFNKAVEINDKIVDAYIGLAIAQKSAGCASDALVTLSLAAAIQPNSSLLFSETAILQFKSGFGEDYSIGDEKDKNDFLKAAIAAHQRQIAQQPQNPELHYRLGILMMGATMMPQAVKSFQAALDINPTYHRAKSKLAVCLFESNQKDQALGQLTPAACLDKKTLELHYKTALLYCDKIKFASSLINLDRLMENNFACSQSTANISVVLQNLGLLDRVTTMLDNLAHTTNQAINHNL
jgi:tetratricopeptide (TPR) repeat protein